MCRGIIIKRFYFNYHQMISDCAKMQKNLIFLKQMNLKVSIKDDIKTSIEVLRRSLQWAFNTHTHTERVRERQVN